MFALLFSPIMIIYLGRRLCAIPDIIKGSFSFSKQIYCHKEYDAYNFIWMLEIIMSHLIYASVNYV